MNPPSENENAGGEEGEIVGARIAPAKIAGECDGITMGFLLQLPLKDLISFKLVSKGWGSLISSHYFCSSRVRQNPSLGISHGVLLVLVRNLQCNNSYIPLHPVNPPPPPFLDFSFTSAPTKTKILHYCNGLLVCASSNLWDGIYNILQMDDCDLYVYNPTMDCSVRVPYFPLESYQCVSLVFDPLNSPTFKLILVDIRLVQTDSDEEEESTDVDWVIIWIFSSDTGRWTCGGKIEDSKATHVDFGFGGGGGGVYWNGSMHWRHILCQLPLPENATLLRYDVDSTAFLEMPAPPAQWVGFLYFGVSANYLHIIEPLYVVQSSAPKLKVYELQSHNSHWIVKFKVNLHPISTYPNVIRSAGDQEFYLGYILSFVRGGDEGNMMVMRILDAVLKYNVDKGTLEKLSDIDGQFMPRDPVELVSNSSLMEHAFDYMESICCCGLLVGDAAVEEEQDVEDEDDGMQEEV